MHHVNYETGGRTEAAVPHPSSLYFAPAYRAQNSDNIKNLAIFEKQIFWIPWFQHLSAD